MAHTLQGNPSLETGALRRHALAHDASHFLVIPQAVSTLSCTDDVVALMRHATMTGQAITFRSGGTSLSGQASGAGILADTRMGFRSLELLDGGRQISVEPGVSLRQANARLLATGHQMGPDPASEIACTIGGVIANNSSGMTCGIRDNAYQTLRSAEIVLASGTRIDTADSDADRQLEIQEPELYQALVDIRERIVSNPESVATIGRLFSIKNTMGYSLNAFVDYERPIDILLHLMVGSEGTLGFIARAVFDTIDYLPNMLTGLLVFPRLEDATRALPAIISSGAVVAELLDASSLQVARGDSDVVNLLPAKPHEDEAALLVEYRARSSSELDTFASTATKLISELQALPPSAFTTDQSLRGAMWRLRKGLFASVAATRGSGQLSLLEDIAVPMERLLDTIVELRGLFDRYGYVSPVIFGHAKDGNIHFLINESFSDAARIARFESFTEDLVELVLSQGGTLKAEHGTGRMMAPYLRRQYGDELYEVMAQIKQAFDPQGILNPGIIINDDPKIHVTDLKAVPEIEQEADRCVECGYCELVCPSKDLTLTPRQRIVLRRDIAQARDRGDRRLVRELEKGYDYEGLDTCAVDGMCATACPVSIDTGSLVRRLRSEKPQGARDALWGFAARHWSATTRLVSGGLSLAKALPSPLVSSSTRVARFVLGKRDIPQWTKDLPAGGKRRSVLPGGDGQIILLASCTGTMFGHSTPSETSHHSSEEAFFALCQRAGISVSTLAGADGLCCGTPWSSKGLPTGLQEMRQSVEDAVKEIPADAIFVSDASSCTEGYRKLLQDSGRTVVDSVTIIADVLDRLPVSQKLRQVVVHPTCSGEKLGSTADLMRIARHLAEDVVVAPDWNCCGFAGDRGMLHPELTASATSVMAEQLRQFDADAYVSANRTCELGMTRAVGSEFVGVLGLLATLTAELEDKETARQ